MLIQFTVGNFRSIKDPITLSMVGANLRAKDKTLDEQNTITIDSDLTLLKSAAIYGANASGKSNLVRALLFMRAFVLHSVQGIAGPGDDKIPDERFRLSEASEKEPSFFEVVFLLNSKKYRYGFEVTPQRVVSEWLFDTLSREANLFERTYNGETEHIKASSRFKAGKRVQAITREDALFLSVAAQFNEATAQSVRDWFEQLIINPGLDHNADLHQASEQFERQTDTEKVERFIRALDLGIEKIVAVRRQIVSSSTDPKDAAIYKIVRALQGLDEEDGRSEFVPELVTIFTSHRRFDSQGNVVDPAIFEMAEHESAGTRRIFSLARPILAALEGGRVLVVDELDARLHPLISSTIIDLFNSKETNPKGAQLIFTTHDTNLLNNKRFRRDQIWFVEKNRFGATDLYSLAEFKVANGIVRNDASYEGDYIRGKYGAIPFLTNDLQWVLGVANAES